MSKLRKHAAAYEALLVAIDRATSLEELKAGRVAPADQPWEPLYSCDIQLPEHEAVAAAADAHGLGVAELSRAASAMVMSRSAYTNREYLVLAEAQLGKNEGWVHLSITRHDGKPGSAWDDLQRIKNEVVGSACEGVELYPAEGRRLGGGNTAHLWVTADPTARFHIGYHP